MTMLNFIINKKTKAHQGEHANSNRATFMLKASVSFVAASLLILTAGNAQAQTRYAKTDNINQIINWAKDGVTSKIIFSAGTYNFSKRLTITNNNLVLDGKGKNKTILKLTANQPALIDAIGNNAVVTDMTLNGNYKQAVHGHPIFRFNKSKGHKLQRVLITKSKMMGIASVNGWATDGLIVKDSEFSNIEKSAIRVLNRNTETRGSVITSVNKVTITNNIFREGYGHGVSIDAGNDFSHDSTDANGNKIGRRYTQSVDMHGSVVKGNTFEKTKDFHIAVVQIYNFKVIDNDFLGMTDDAISGANALHFEQFTKNIEIYDNNFHMSDSVTKPFPYIVFLSNEGLKRVSQSRASNTYKSWTFINVSGSSQRASNACTSRGNVDKNCKRGVHAYGPRNIYIAGNTFNDSSKISKYMIINEGENIQVCKKKNGTVSLNSFFGGNNATTKISLSGQDKGTCAVTIQAGQLIKTSNVSIGNVSYDSAHCKNTKPIIIK